jgi:hypothetical protein
MFIVKRLTSRGSLSLAASIGYARSVSGRGGSACSRGVAGDEDADAHISFRILPPSCAAVSRPSSFVDRLPVSGLRLPALKSSAAACGAYLLQRSFV